MFFFYKLASKFKILFFVIFVFFLGANSAQAVTILSNPLGDITTVPQLIGRVLAALLGLTGSVALIIFIYGGFLWMTSRGDAGKVKQGREAMIWAVLGLLIIFASYAILDFVITALSGSTAAPAATAVPTTTN